MVPKRLQKKRLDNPGRGGRPSAAQAGEVQARVLEAAKQVFLERGFQATTFDRIASVARASKATIYAHYGSKEELFRAIVRTSVERNMKAGRTIDPYLSLTERMEQVGTDILHHTLQPKPLAMMRLVIETAHRFPEVAQHANRIGWEGGVDRVARVIAARDLGAVGTAKPAAAWFISLTFAPMQMRALLGEKSADLQAAAPQQIADAITMLYRGGWLEGWS